MTLLPQTQVLKDSPNDVPRVAVMLDTPDFLQVPAKQRQGVSPQDLFLDLGRYPFQFFDRATHLKMTVQVRVIRTKQ